MHVARWGRSAYETDADLAREAQGLRELGACWSFAPSNAAPPTADLLVCPSSTRVDAQALARFGGRLVQTTTSGYDHVDLAAAAALGVQVARLPEPRRDAVVEHALALMLALMRRLPALEQAAVQGRWARAELPALAPRGLRGADVLLIGLGVIGRRMASVLDALGANVFGVDPAGVPTPAIEIALDEGLAFADVVSLHCALTPSSRGLIDARRLALMQPHAVLINTARGPLLNPELAVEAVRTGRLRGLGCDVFPQEPWPRLAQGAAVPGVRFSPHASGYTHDLGERVAEGVIAVVAGLLAGAPLAHRVA